MARPPHVGAGEAADEPNGEGEPRAVERSSGDGGESDDPFFGPESGCARTSAPVDYGWHGAAGWQMRLTTMSAPRCPTQHRLHNSLFFIIPPPLCLLPTASSQQAGP